MAKKKLCQFILATYEYFFPINPTLGPHRSVRVATAWANMKEAGFRIRSNEPGRYKTLPA